MMETWDFISYHVLGPVLFNLFTADLTNLVQSPSPQYADDTVVYRTINCNNDSVTLQEDLNLISGWCKENCMRLNSSKCKVMHITRSKKQSLTPYFVAGSDEPLQVSQSYKYLEVILSDDLTWKKKHVDMVRTKCSTICGFIRCTVKTRNKDVLLHSNHSLLFAGLF